MLESVLASVPDALLVVSPAGEVRYVNEAALELFGRGREDFVGELLGFSVSDGASSEVNILREGTVSRICQMRVAQIDWETEELRFHDLDNAAAQEPLFVPRRADAPEGDGFILTAVDRFADRRTDLLILDGNDVSRPPLATVKLPFALPMAFHGSWMAS